MIAGLMSLVLQLLLTGRVLRTVGVGPALFIVPTAMLMGSTGRVAARHARRGRGAEGQRSGAALLDRQGHGGAAVSAGAGRAHVPRQVVHRHGRVSARRCRRRPRRAAVCGGARLVAGAACRGSASCSSAMWLAAAYVARRQYVENLRESIHQHRVDSERASMPVMDRDTTSLISSRLKGTPKEIAYALSLFEMAHDRKVHPAVRGPAAITKMPEIRQQAIRLLARAGDASVKDQVEAARQGSGSRRPHRGAAVPDRVRSNSIRCSASRRSAISKTSRSGPRSSRSWRGPGRSQNIDAAKLLAVEDGRGAGRRRAARPPRGGAADGGAARCVRSRAAHARGRRATSRWRRAAIVAVGALKKRALIGDLIDRLAEPALNEAVVAALAGVRRSHRRHAARLPDRRVDARPRCAARFRRCWRRSDRGRRRPC